MIKSCYGHHSFTRCQRIGRQSAEEAQGLHLAGLLCLRSLFQPVSCSMAHQAYVLLVVRLDASLSVGVKVIGVKDQTRNRQR
jgi:hypothetical protein